MSEVFIICPVRNVDEETKNRISFYVTELEKQGKKVHWPPRDTHQDDPHGINICGENREAIYWADEVHIWFDIASQGSLFDVGMTFAFLRSMNKKIVIINRDQVLLTPHKSFQNVLLKLAG